MDLTRSGGYDLRQVNADRPHAFAYDGVIRRVWPFALAVVVALASLPFVDVRRPALVIAAGVLVVAMVPGVAFARWERLPRCAAVVPPVVLVVVVFLLREATGGIGNPVDYEALLMLAVLWVALYGDRVELVIVVLVSAGTFAASVVIAGGGGGAWVKAVLWPTVAVIVGLRGSALVRQVTIQSRSDPLTGLANRARWEEELPREVARSRRYAHALSVAVIDIDHFKRINDRDGHAAGDRLLRDAAVAWSAQLRAGDLLARYGGEEFVLLLPGTGLAEARRVVDRVRGSTPAAVTCSAGVTELRADDWPAALVARADEALYAAKRSGRNRTNTA